MSSKFFDDADTEVDPVREQRFTPAPEASPEDRDHDGTDESGIVPPVQTQVKSGREAPRSGALLDLWFQEKQQERRGAESAPQDGRFLRVDHVRIRPSNAGSGRKLEDRCVRLRGRPQTVTELSVGLEGRMYTAPLGPADSWSAALQSWCEAVGIRSQLVVVEQSGERVVFGFIDPTC